MESLGYYDTKLNRRSMSLAAVDIILYKQLIKRGFMQKYKAYVTFDWNHSKQWHTLFSYLALDWTFVGAIVMGIVIYIYTI